MKTSTSILKNMLCFAIAIMTLGLSAQTIITVDNNPGSTTTQQTIQEAIDAATAGDIIYVQPSGTSYGHANVTKALTIVGRSHSENNRVSTLGTVSIRSSNVTIKGINFGNLNFSATGASNPPPFVGTKIYECEFASATLGITSVLPVDADDIEIRGNIIRSGITQYVDGINVLISNNIFLGGSPLTIYDPTSIVVANNIFKYFSSGFNLTNQSSSGTVILFNNMFIINETSDGTISFNNGPFNLSNCLTYNYGTGNISFTSNGSGSYLDSNTLSNTNPLFTDVDNTANQSFAGSSGYNPAFRPEDDLTLQAGSPALTGGGGGSEIGLFNNGFNYKYLGNPRGVPVMDIISYDGAVPKNGSINVTITSKAH
ncbi:hypothetical protein [Algibacter sp. 2305UL17-15]|uniref:hypothetical protein n=1 Tax=Algibacter sp. 2305UL17-15 TaxID=3231268 RepID=UPI00345820FB